MFLSKAGPDFDSDRLNRALRTRKIEEWGLVTAGIKSGGAGRLAALHEAITEAYDKSREASDDPRYS